MRLGATKAGATSTYNGLGNQLWDLSGARPILDLRFADNKSLVDDITGTNFVTFTRASSGTYIGSDGLIKTATTDEPRFNHNPVTGESLGLLVEEQRSNLLLNSGTLSTQNVTVTAVAHTLSFTGTGTITLSGTSTAGPLVGTGIGESSRVSLTFTPTAGTLTLTVSGTVTNAQLEIGSFKTSYIPTTTVAVTRSADVASISGSNFSSWYQQDNGTVFASAFASFNSSATTERVVGISDGSTSNRIIIYRNCSTSIAQTIISTGSTTQASITEAGWLSATRLNSAVAYATNNVKASFGGSEETTDTSASMPNVNRMIIGANESGAASLYLNSTIHRITYWPTRLPDETLKTITQ